MKKSKRMTTGEAIFLLIAGLILGTVFTFGMKYSNAPITQKKAQQLVDRKQRHSIKNIELEGAEQGFSTMPKNILELSFGLDHDGCLLYS